MPVYETGKRKIHFLFESAISGLEALFDHFNWSLIIYSLQKYNTSTSLHMYVLGFSYYLLLLLQRIGLSVDSYTFLL